jgi:glycosyltransferase 2 family protein
LIWLLSQQDWLKVWAVLRQIPIWVVLSSFCLYLVGMLANVIRWLVILRTARIVISWQDTARIVFAGVFASNFLPSTVGGDFVRFIGLGRFTPDRALNLASIVLDRLVNLTAFLTVLPLSLLIFRDSLPGILQTFNPGITIAWMGFVDVRGWIGKVVKTLLRWIERLRATFQIWLRQPARLFLAFCISWFSIFVIFLAIWLLARGLGMQVALYQVMGVTVITYLATLLPISVNGYGLREILIVGLYTSLGSSLEQAAVLAVISRFLSMLVTLPGAIWIGKILSIGDSNE